MPELPEVEVTRRSFADRIQGARIVAAEPGLPLRWPLGRAPEDLVGQTVAGVDRRGKYLLLRLDDGVLLVHLGMSGSLAFRHDLPPPGKHDHFDLITTRGTLRLHDPRRFGAVVWSPGLDADPARKLLSTLGVEPLDGAFDAAAFHAGLRRRRAPIKQVLLAGDVVVGVGNIYASEALFRAGLSPRRAAGRLTREQSTKLVQAIKDVLGEAVRIGGTTLRDYVNADGAPGYFAQKLFVYERGGEACRRCGTTVRHAAQGQRSTYWCPRCQR